MFKIQHHSWIMPTRALLLFVTLFCSSSAWSQATNGGVTGRVFDASGAVLPAVSIRLTDVDTQAVRTASSDRNGEFAFTLLPPGRYELRAELSGFSSVVQRNVIVLVNQITDLPVNMKPATVSTEVEVTGEAPVLQTQSSAVGGVIEHTAITSLPLNGRNFIQLVALQPGAVSTAKLPNGGISYLTSLFGGNYVVNGAPSDGSSYLLDGIEMRDTNDTRVGFEMTVDAIQEFNFQSLNYSSAYGAASGGVVNVSSRGGTNNFHGSGWEFFRNDALDARNYFDSAKPKYHQNQFGGALGGPIVHDKMFFFLSYEGYRQLKGVSRAVSVPTLAQRSGNFSGGNPIFDPNNVDPVTGLRQPFAGNQIPAGRLNSIAVAALNALYPLPNRAGVVNNLFATGFQHILTDQANGRIDRRFGANDTLFGRWTWVRVDRNIPFYVANGLPNFTMVYNSPAQNGVISETHNFGTNTVNQAEIGYNRHIQVAEDAQQHVAINQMLGIGGTSTQYLGNPTITISGFGTTGVISNAPNDRTDNDYTFADNLSLVRGSHTYTAGIRIVYNQVNGQVTPSGHGTFNFNGAFTSQLTPTGTQSGTGSAVADFLLGYPFSTANCCLVGSPHHNNRRKQIGLYFQHDWRATPKLTLNMGLRWDYFGHLYDLNDHFDFPDLTKAPNLVLLFAGKNGVSTSIANARYTDFAPRVGFAYALRQNTVVRAGYGLFFNPTSMVYGVTAGVDPPFVDQSSFTSSSRTPQLTLANPFPTGLGIPSTVYTGWDPNRKDPYSQAWNLSIQQGLGHEMSLTLEYVGNKGSHEDLGAVNVNAPPPGPGAIGPRRPIPTVSNVNIDLDIGKSIYHGFTIKSEKRFGTGLGFLASYTWSKCIDTGALGSRYDGADSSGRNPLDTNANRGLCGNDERHRAVASFIYNLPFGRHLSGFANTAFANWRIEGILSLESGQPFNVLLPNDNSNTGRLQDFPDLVPGQDPNDGPRTATRWFNVNAFKTAAPFTFGNAGRNITIGPPFKSLDFTLGKNFKLTERQTLEFRAEAFNIVNHTNFLQPGRVFGTPTFGVIGGAFDPRQIQFAFKYTF